MQIRDWETALSAQSEVLALMTSSLGKHYASIWLRDRELKYGRSAALPSQMGFDMMVEDLMVAEPLYVAPEMHHLVLDAMQTFDAREPLHQEDVLFPCGFAYLSEPYLGKDMIGKTAAFRAIHWRMGFVDLSEQYAVDNDGEAGPQMCLTITLWSHTDDRDDYSDTWLTPLQSPWGVLHTTVMPIAFVNDLDHTRGEGDRNADWITYLRVLHRLMAEVITSPSRRRTSRPVWREAKRRGMPEVKDVVVVELRRIKHVNEDESEKAHYSHSFMVRGHWRWQPYGPGHAYRRQKWISPYIKGEGDFIEKDRVWVWHR